MKLIQISLLSLLLFLACSKANDKKQSDNKDNGDCNIYATMENKTGFDGCGWALQLRDGSYLEPTNLSSFGIKLTDNKAVLISYTVRGDLASICMVGEIVDIDCMQEYH